MQEICRKIEDVLFSICKVDCGWAIRHKCTGKSMGIDFEAVPENSSDDYVLGFAKCLAYQENWINP